MSDVWAVRLAKQDAASLGRLRRTAGILVCEDGDYVWLSGPHADQSLDRQLRSLPGAQRFRVLADRQLVPAGLLVPRGHVPQGTWLPLADWMQVSLEPAAFAGQLQHRASLQMVRSVAVRECNVLVTSMDAWASYGSMAPQVRLDRWAFAASDCGQVVVRGVPLPSVPGRRFVEQEGVASEAGWTWSSPVDAAVIRQLLRLESNDLALLHADGTWDWLPASQFVRATRSAIRASQGVAADG